MKALYKRASEAKRALTRLSNPIKKAFFPRFFKTKKGEYGEGDQFLGVTVPQIRSIVAGCTKLPLSEVKKLLEDPFHECRLLAVLILVRQYKDSNVQDKKKIADFYCSHRKHINNWDIVDASAHLIIGPHVDAEKNISLLNTYAQCEHLWTQRIAIIATLHFIRKGIYEHTFRIADLLINHSHDLIHKAVGWMLREVGKRNEKAEKAFLKTRYKTMPRTMLRYAIEKFPEKERQRYLRGEV